MNWKMSHLLHDTGGDTSQVSSLAVHLDINALCDEANNFILPKALKQSWLKFETKMWRARHQALCEEANNFILSKALK